MARQEISMGLSFLLVALLWAGSMAQSNDCTNVIISMSPCLSYITGNSSTPSRACCTQLGTVVNSQPQCLCQVLSGGGSNLGLNINQTQALALPQQCNVQTPPVSRCNAASPSGTPINPGSTPSSPNSGGGSKTVPTSGNGASDATSNKLAVSLLFCVLFASSYVLNFKMA